MMARRNITDRAFRYRAQASAPTTEKSCAYCGAKRGASIDVGHVDGHEENNDPQNLIWTCRPCNVAAGNTLRAAGLGRVTNQYNGGRRSNPAKKAGAQSLGQWIQAVGAITPHQDRGERGLVSDMDVRAAVQMIRDTPQSRRSKFAAELNRHKSAQARSNPKRQNMWPFSDARTSPRQTTAASGGIAKFSAGVKAKAKKAVASAKKSGAYESIPTAAAIERAYASGAKTLNEALEMAGARMNPPRFDRCVKDVKKKGRGVNAYAVCTASGTRNPSGISIVPSSRRKGMWTVLVNGVPRTTKPTLKGAEGYARRLQTDNEPPKRNPADEAIAGYQDFHGRPPEEFVEVSRKVHFHSNLSGAGELKRLVVLAVDGKSVVTLTKFKRAILAFNEKRNQLFVEGGDQAVDPGDFGITSPHELETLGRVKKIDYFTRKDHLGSEGGTATYQHTFRTTNEDGRHVTIRIARYPDLIYRVLEQHLEFSGGSYEILPEGIDR
jgi:hypothetical protein